MSKDNESKDQNIKASNIEASTNKEQGITRRQAIISIAGIGAGLIFKPNAAFSFPQTKNGLRFAVLGDWGIGTVGQINVAEQMMAAHAQQPLDFVMTTGDNIYPFGESRLFPILFERPYAGLLRDGVNFYAALGNHDIMMGREAQLNYRPFNMGGKNYYSLKKGGGLAEFFILDTNDAGPTQLGWLEEGLRTSKARWKIVNFHHPLYSSARSHGSDLILRQRLEPLLVRYNVNVVFTGHDHTYERVKLQQGVQHFVTGGGGAVRPGDIILQSPFREVSYDQGNHFMLIEINDKQLEFQAISETGAIIDRGTIKSNLK